MKEYFRKPYMTVGITKHSDYMKAIPQRAIDVQGQIAPNIEFKKPYDFHPNSPQMIHYYANNLHYLGGDPVPPLNDPSLLPHAPVVETPEVPVEVYDKYTVVLLHFDGVDAATTFVDEKGNVWTPSGDAQIDNDYKVFGNGSGLFDGTGDRLVTTTSAIFNPGSQNFTVDFRVRFTTLPVNNWQFLLTRAHVLSGIARKWYCALLNSGGVNTWYFRAISALDVAYINVAFASPGLVNDIWYHIAFVRNGSSFLVFQDGIQCGTTATDVDPITACDGNILIGAGLDSAGSIIYHFNGRLDEFRYSLGIARWTENFTPPTKEY